ncbi:MAG: TldD/PmbA family protein [Spirulinaceae cyanobacterium SM2_1_0]|nr:TldD/PmbA family protein [Spirulinaceae cyanobacterium SM2_1_0]
MIQAPDLARYTGEIAQKLGIHKYDVYGSSVDSTSVQVDRGEPKQVKASQRSSVIARVWNENGQIGVTSTTAVDPRGLELALQTAAEASAFGVKENVPDFSPEAAAPLAEIQRPTASPASAATLIDTLLAAEKELLDAHPAIASVPYNGLTQQASERFYLNSDGALRSEARTYATLYLYSKTEQEGKKPRSAGSYRISSGLQQLDIAGCLQEAREKTISHLDYQKIKSGKYRAVFSAEAFLSLLGAFSNLFNAQSVLDRQSLSTPDSLGQAIASPLLSVFDDALHADNVAAETFDGEGTPTRRISLIENGVLSSFLHSTGTAKRLQAQPTGHANLGAKVTVSPHFFHVQPGQSTDQTLSLADAENVIWIDDLSALHAGVNALQGSFSLPFDGWLVNRGDRQSIDSATIAGDFRELLRAITYIEPDAELTPSGLCPRIWVDNLSVTGE